MECSECKYFEYEEIWDGEEEHRFYICHCGHYEEVYWSAPACEDFVKALE